MRPAARPLVPAMLLAALVAAPGVARAQMQTGPFIAGQPPFEGPGGSRGLLRAADDAHIEVDSNGDGVPDTTYTLPAPLQNIVVVDERLSPTEKVLYTRETTANSNCANRVHFYRLDAPPDPVFLASVCLDASVAIGPLFYDPFPGAPIRTAVVVSRTNLSTFKQEIVWVDLVNGGHNADVSTYDADVEQLSGVTFAPSGNAALVKHGTTLIDATPKFTLIDLCRSRVAAEGSRTTFERTAFPPPFPQPGSISGHVAVSNTGQFNAELWVDSTPTSPAVGITLDNCLVPVTLELAKSPSNLFVPSGQDFSYTLSVRNAGVSQATNVVLEDTVPAGTTFVSATMPHTRQSNIVRWDLGTIAGGQTQSVTLTVRPACAGTLPALFRNDQYSVVSDQTARLNGIAVLNACIPPPPVVLSINKSGPAQARQGESFTYTLDYTNTGTQTALGVIVEDTLPAGAVFVSATANPTVSGGLVRWTIGSVAAGGRGSVTLTVRAGCVSQLTNSQYSIRSGSTAAVTGPPVVTNVAAASLAPIDIAVTSSPITRMPPLQRGDVVQHVITLRNTVSESRPYVSIQISAGRAARFDQVIDAAGGNVRLISPQILEWSGPLAADATVSIIVTTRMEDCLGPSDTFTQLNDGRPIQVLDVCNRVLGSQSPPPPFAVLPPVVASLKVLGASTPQDGSPGIAGLVQPVRAGSEIDLQLTLTNQTANPEATVSFNFVLPDGLTAGTPPFVTPTDPAAVYDEAARRVSWSGALDPGATIRVTVRVQVPSSGICSLRVNASGSTGACQNLGANVTLLAVPEVSSDRHLVSTDQRLGLWTFTPGIDTAFRALLCFPGEIYTGMDRAANGDIWVSGLPNYRLNPERLELQVVDDQIIAPQGFKLPVDVAIDRTNPNAKPIFLVPDSVNRSRLAQFDPATGAVTVIRDSLPGMSRIVIDREGRIAGVNGRADSATGTPAGVILIDPANAANDRVLTDPAFPRLDFSILDTDADGTFIVAAPVDPLVAFGTQNLVRIEPGVSGPGTFSLIATDLASLIPPPPFNRPVFTAVAIGAAGDVYLGRHTNGSLGVLHGTTPPTGELLTLSPNIIDLEFIDPAAAPPPPPTTGPVNIDITEAVLVADGADLVTGIVLQVDEQVTVSDAVDLLPGVVLQIDEQVAVNDTVDLVPGILVVVTEPITVGDEIAVTVPDNTPAGTNVLVPLRDLVTGRLALTARFPIVTRSGRTAFTTGLVAPPPPSGFRAGLPPIVYDVTTTAAFTGQATICIDESVQQFTRPRPHVFHFESGAWVDRTTTFDTTTQFPCALVSTLSPFALFEPVDDTAPELAVRFDPARLDLAVFAIDDLAGVPSVEVPALPGRGSQFRRYKVEDAAGNTLEAIIRVRLHCGHERSAGDHRLEAAIVSLQYGDDPPRKTADNALTFEWTFDRHGVLKRLDQEITVGSGRGLRTVEARFDAKRGVTTIREARETKKAPVERRGLVLLRLQTAQGRLLIDY